MSRTNWVVFTLDGAVEFVELGEALEFIEFWNGHCILVSMFQPPMELIEMLTAVMIAYMQTDDHDVDEFLAE